MSWKSIDVLDCIMVVDSYTFRLTDYYGSVPYLLEYSIAPLTRIQGANNDGNLAETQNR